MCVKENQKQQRQDKQDKYKYYVSVDISRFVKTTKYIPDI